MSQGTSRELKEIPPKAADLSEWYTAVCLRAELVSYSPVRGCIVLRPYGYGMWERLQDALDLRFKATGHENAYFPLLIPESLLMQEAAHVEGFAPEVAWVTQGGSEKLTERLAIRPTSEVMIGAMYSQWIQSHRDLPVLINQWCNVVRWEKATRPFLRTMEFLWQEGHTAHVSEQEANQESLQMLGVYRDVAESVAAVPVYAGEKSSSERFAGATHTYSIEALMPDGKALQAATSHELGQNFARAYDITFSTADQSLQHVWTTSWGMSWRMLGGMIMVHGDDRGLRVPPQIAPVQAVIVPIIKGKDTAPVHAAHRLAARLRTVDIRVKVDDRDRTAGWKFSEWEMRGVPIRIEIGPRDLANGTAVIVRRDKQKGDKSAKSVVETDEVGFKTKEFLGQIQQSMFDQAREFLAAHTYVEQDRSRFFELCRRRAGMVDIAWCDRLECEAYVKEQTTATSRNLRPLEVPARCVACGEPAKVRAYFAQSY
ncbi:MAG: proline--tRNA ligase [Candidatus Eremiobacteraeota bacterium]|nr:proline--tRNA ligase [Candidatus Eremiobacteraeota bacterium]